MSKLENIFATDISEQKEFTFEGTRLVQCEHNEQTGLWLYERYTKDDRLFGYEIVKGVKKKNPDGSIVYAYPGSSLFGIYGWFYPPKSKRDALVESLAIGEKMERYEFIHNNALNW